MAGPQRAKSAHHPRAGGEPNCQIGPGNRRAHLKMCLSAEETLHLLTNYLIFHTGRRFSAKALGPSSASSISVKR